MNQVKSGALFLLLAVVAATGCSLPVGGTTGHGGSGGGGSGGGAPMVTSASDASSSGSSSDTSAPTVVSTSPTMGAVGVAPGTAIHATFSEAMSPASVSAATFTLTSAGVAVKGTVTYAGTTATFAPASPLPFDSSFVATVSTGVTDLAGNPLASAVTWTFATLAQPTVLATTPTDGEQGVVINKHLQAAFSVAMDPATVTGATFFVKQGATPVPGVVSYAGTTATFTPTTSYAPSATLTATITTGARDLAGTGLAKDDVWTFKTGTTANQEPVALGLLATYALLAADTIANTASLGTVVTGDLGIAPGAALTGFPPGILNGATVLGAAAAPVQADFVTAYNEAAGRPGGAPLPADLTGLTFTPGLYKQVTAVALSTGSCTLDAQGVSDGVFVFQVGTTLGLAASTNMILVGGAKASNVYWTVGGATTLGAGAKLKGTVLTAAGITVGAGADIEGRLLAHGGSVTLDSDTIKVPVP